MLVGLEHNVPSQIKDEKKGEESRIGEGRPGLWANTGEKQHQHGFIDLNHCLEALR